MISRIFILLFLITGLSNIVSAQNVLRLDDAISIGLQNNFGIKYARNQAKIGEINKSIGNAGFLPSLDITGYWDIEKQQPFIHQIPVDAIPEHSEVLHGNVSLNWTVFDGLRMFTNYQMLSRYQKLSDVEARIFVENIVTRILINFYNIVQHQKRIAVLENSLDISNERLAIAEAKYALGSGSEYEVILARTDLNTDKSALIREEVSLNEARSSLMQLLSVDTDYEFTVTSDISIYESFNLSQLIEDAAVANRELEAIMLEESIADFELKNLRRQALPEVSIGTGIDSRLSYNQSPESYSDGRDLLYFGVTARINVFDGFNRNRLANVAEIQHQNAVYRTLEHKRNLEHFITTEFANFMLTRELVELEEANLEYAEQSLEMALERFKLSAITSIEMRETQRTLLDTENRLISASFEAKIYETELLRLSGKLGENYGF